MVEQFPIVLKMCIRDSPQPFNPETDGLKADSSSDKTLEIGWNIPETASADSLKFDVSMLSLIHI